MPLLQMHLLGVPWSSSRGGRHCDWGDCSEHAFIVHTGAGKHVETDLEHFQSSGAPARKASAKVTVHCAFSLMCLSVARESGRVFSLHVRYCSRKKKTALKCHFNFFLCSKFN